MITTVSSSTASASTTTSATSNALGQEDFLEILIAQLQNQDPTDPVDTTEFTSQLTQYSSLEQLMNMNTRLDTLIADFESMTGAELAGLIGTGSDSRWQYAGGGWVHMRYLVQSLRERRERPGSDL